MQIAASYSHLNGLEFLMVHQPELWAEIQDVIANVDAESHRTKESKEKTKAGKMLYAPKELNIEFKDRFESLGWDESRTSYWVTSDAQLIRRTIQMPAAEQKKQIEDAGLNPIYSYNQTDFVKNRVAIEVQFGKYSFVAFDLFVKHFL